MYWALAASDPLALQDFVSKAVKIAESQLKAWPCHDGFAAFAVTGPGGVGKEEMRRSSDGVPPRWRKLGDRFYL
jgi:hypothetical protein